MRIPINGMSAEALAKTSAEAKSVRRDFPVNPYKYTRFTGLVEKVETKTIGDDEKLAIYARNGECVAEILVNLDVRKTIPGSNKSAEDQAQENLSRLLLAVKVLDLATEDGTGIDDSKYAKARGKAIAFSGKQTGTRVWEGKVFPKTSFFLDGLAQEMTPVQPWTDGSQTHTPAPASSSASGSSTPLDIPF